MTSFGEESIMDDSFSEAFSTKSGPSNRRQKVATYSAIGLQTMRSEGELRYSHPKEASKFESLNYDDIESEVLRNDLKSWTISKFRKIIFAQWIVTLIIGIAVGAAAFAIAECIDYLTQFKFNAVDDLITNTNSLWAGGSVFIAMCTIFVFISSSLVVFVAPMASGSGIPEIICFLNGVHIPSVLSIHTLLVKAVGVILSVSAGLAIGKEGPMIHVGSAIAAGLCQGKSASLKWLDTTWLKYFRNDAAKRDFVSAGAAAGVSAAFGAPVGGVLFSLEEGASFWNQEMTWRAMFCAMTSAFTVNFLLSGMIGGNEWGDMSQAGLFTFGSFSNQINSGYTVWQVPFFILMGACGGIAGSFFNYLSTYLAKARARFVNKSYTKILEVCIVAMVTALITFTLSFYVYTCMPVYVAQNCTCPGQQPTSSYDMAVYQYNCPNGKYNDMMSLFWCGQETAIKHLFHDRSNFSYETLSIFCCVYFFLCLWTNGTSIPSSPFIPSLLIGCCFGRAIGQYLVTIDTHNFLKVDPGTFALIGASAFLGGVVRMTISLTVILMECTNDVTYGLPIMVTLMTAKFVGEIFTHGLYEIMIDLKKIPWLEWDPPPAMRKFNSIDVMNYPVRCFPRVPKVRDVIAMIQSCKHNGFPVVDDNNKFLGLILRSQLYTLLRVKEFRDSEEPSHAYYHKANREDFIADYPRHPPIEDMDIGEVDMEMFMDLTPYMNPLPFTVHTTTSLSRVFRLFRTMGLRHLVVVNSDNEVQGIITRKDLTHLNDKAKALMEKMATGQKPELDDIYMDTESSALNLTRSVLDVNQGTDTEL